MADLNAGYILQGQAPDVVGQLMRGSQAAQQTNQVRQQNALAQLYQTQGAGIMNGDQGALNALAGISPDAALGIQQNRLGMDATRQDMGFQSERMQMARDQAKQQAAEYAAGITAAEAAQHAAEVERGLAAAMTAKTPEQWDQIAQQFGASDLVGQFGNRDAIIGSYVGIAEQLKQRAQTPDPLKGAPEGQMFADPSNPAAGLVPIPGYSPKPADDYGRYVQEQQAAGKEPLSRIDYAQAIKGQGITMTTGPDGTTTTTIGGKGGGKAPAESQLNSAGYLQRMTAAEATLDALDKQGTNTIGLVKGLAVGSRAEGYALSGTEQQLVQAQRDWVRAKLRKESGAVIGADEMAQEMLTYFPQPGDSIATIEQKRESRKAAERQLQITSGDAAGQAGPLTDSAAGGGVTYTFNPDTGELE